MRRLCRFADLGDGASRGFGPAPGGFTGLFAVRRGDAAHVYVNACPHLGVALDQALDGPPDAFLTRDGRHIVCATHGALFTIEGGACVQGPCKGDRLERVEAVIEEGWLLVPEAAGL